MNVLYLKSEIFWRFQERPSDLSAISFVIMINQYRSMNQFLLFSALSLCTSSLMRRIWSSSLSLTSVRRDRRVSWSTWLTHLDTLTSHLRWQRLSVSLMEPSSLLTVSPVSNHHHQLVDITVGHRSHPWTLLAGLSRAVTILSTTYWKVIV